MSRQRRPPREPMGISDDALTRRLIEHLIRSVRNVVW